MGADELEPTIAPPNATSIYAIYCTGQEVGIPGCPYDCGGDCPTPRYLLNGIPITSASAIGKDFGLNDCKLLN